MKKFVRSVALVALLVGVAGISTPSRAETGQVAVVFTKGGFIVGVGGGEGVLMLPRQALSIHRIGHERRLHDRSLDHQVCRPCAQSEGAGFDRRRPTPRSEPGAPSPPAPAAFNCRTPMA